MLRTFPVPSRPAATFAGRVGAAGAVVDAIHSAAGNRKLTGNALPVAVTTRGVQVAAAKAHPGTPALGARAPQGNRPTLERASLEPTWSSTSTDSDQG